ncbi:pilus assembly protein HicB [Sphaerotilus sp.]|uniref:pilus assembly protein HicB n=1 Tax=Sphaerotilus sp. TaxID=2093942 RepID=UPI002ACDA37C|nr:pilus assembly protein HicB [Sphaerotilus sp.]MDZ7856285.1 pilus assembly protein HicB [Sphaerotilus sp.]
MGTPSNYALRLPRSLKTGAEQVAREDGTTLNQFIVSAVAEKLAALKTADYFTERAQRGDVQAAMALLNRAGGQPPTEDDRLASKTVTTTSSMRPEAC